MAELRLMWPVDRLGYDIVKPERRPPPPERPPPPHVASREYKRQWKAEVEEHERQWKAKHRTALTIVGSFLCEPSIVAKGKASHTYNTFSKDALWATLADTKPTEAGVLA